MMTRRFKKRKAGRILWTSVRKLCGAFGSGHIIWTKCSHPGKLKPPPGPAEYRTRRPVRGKQLCSNRVEGCTLPELHDALYRRKTLLQAWSYRGVPVVFPTAESGIFLSPLAALEGEGAVDLYPRHRSGAGAPANEL